MVFDPKWFGFCPMIVFDLKGQKLVENDKIQKSKCDILGDFQTLCRVSQFWANYVSVFATISDLTSSSHIISWNLFFRITNPQLFGIFTFYEHRC